MDSFWLEALGTESRYYAAGGFRTRCIEAGTGEPVILLHGLGGHAETWIRNVASLSKFFHVYAVDMLGHGLTAKPEIDYTIEALATHVCSFMDAIGAKRAAIVGQSLGGWVGGWLAVHQPDRVSALASVTGAGLEVSPDGAELTRQVGAKVRDATNRAIDRPTREGVRTRLEWLMYDKSVVTDELVETRYRIYSDPEFLSIAQRLVDGLTGEIKPEHMLTPGKLERITCPTLVLWTRQNPTMPWQVGQTASELIPNASFYLMENAGHWPQFEKPPEFHDVLIKFLLGCNSMAGTAVAS